MTRDDVVSRRTVVQLAGAAASTTLIAGCLGGDDGDSITDPDEWEDVDEIRLEGEMNHWIGLSPDPIDGVENPTLVLFEGREYDVTWENTDGQSHNIQVRGDGDPLEGTEQMNEEGETQTLTFEATSGMDEYICEPHITTMVGDIEVYSE